MNRQNLNRRRLRLLCAPVITLAATIGVGPAAQSAHFVVPSASPLPSGVPMLVNFDDLSPGAAVYNQYPGVTFIDGDAGYHPITITQPAAGTISTPNALKSQVNCEICGSNLSIQFAIPQDRVSLSTGLAPGLPNANVYAMELTAYQGTPSSPGALITQSFTGCLGNSATPITQPLEVDDPSVTIGYVVLSQVLCDHTQSYDGQPLLLDNLLYDRPLIPAPADHTPPVVTITDPANLSTVGGSTPGATATTLTATVTEDALYSMTAQVNGHTPVLMSYGRTGPSTYTATAYLGSNDGLVDGNNTVVVTATDFDTPQNTGSSSVSFTFKTKPLPPPNTVDIWPTAVEVTQSIDDGPRALTAEDYNAITPYDAYDVNVSSYLVQGKTALVRIYGAVSGAAGPVANVPAVAFVYKANCSSNCLLPGGGEMAPISRPNTPNLGGITLQQTSAAAAVPVSQAPSLNRTWNFLVPASWTNTDLVMEIFVNQGTYGALGNTPRIPECDSATANQTCQFNNDVELQLHFAKAPTMTVDPVVVHVTGSYNGKSYNNVQPSQQQIDNIFTVLNEMFPAKVIEGNRTDITVSPGISKDDLLGDVGGCGFLQACASVGIPLGIFPGDQGPFGPNEKQPDGSIVVGYGKVGGLGAWADANAPVDSAHELGHNIGFDHWACENGVSNDECGHFPIPHGGTGIWTMDIANWKLIPPGDDSSNSTPHAHDFMSYGQLCSIYTKVPGCDLGEWTSWYDWNILYYSSDVGTYDSNDPPALVVRGTISPRGTATFSPIYRAGINRPIDMPITEDDAGAIYTIQGYDAAGNTLFVHNFEPTKVDIHNASYGRAFSFEEPVPVMPGMAQVELFNGSKDLGGVRDLANGKTPTVTVTSPAAGAAWKAGTTQNISWAAASPAGRPLTALVQYSADGGKSYVTLARDVTGKSLLVNTSQIGGAGSAHIYVTVSDGFNSTKASSGTFSVGFQAPSVHIVRPTGGSRVVGLFPLLLQGAGFDREQTLVDKQFHWYLDGKLVGTGRLATVPRLNLGHHTIRFTATDSGNRTGSATVTITAVPAPSVFQVGVRGLLRAKQSTDLRITLRDTLRHRPVKGALVVLNGRVAGIKQMLHAHSNKKGMVKLRVRPLHRGTVTLTISKRGFLTRGLKLSVKM